MKKYKGTQLPKEDGFYWLVWDDVIGGEFDIVKVFTYSTPSKVQVWFIGKEKTTVRTIEEIDDNVYMMGPIKTPRLETT